MKCLSHSNKTMVDSLFYKLALFIFTADCNYAHIILSLPPSQKVKKLNDFFRFLPTSINSALMFSRLLIKRFASGCINILAPLFIVQLLLKHTFYKKKNGNQTIQIIRLLRLLLNLKSTFQTPCDQTLTCCGKMKFFFKCRFSSDVWGYIERCRAF